MVGFGFGTRRAWDCQVETIHLFHQLLYQISCLKGEDQIIEEQIMTSLEKILKIAQ